MIKLNERGRQILYIHAYKMSSLWFWPKMSIYTIIQYTKIYNSEVNLALTYVYHLWDNLKSIIDEVFLLFIKEFISLYDVLRHLCAMVTEICLKENPECQSSASTLFENVCFVVTITCARLTGLVVSSDSLVSALHLCWREVHLLISCCLASLDLK